MKEKINNKDITKLGINKITLGDVDRIAKRCNLSFDDVFNVIAEVKNFIPNFEVA